MAGRSIREVLLIAIEGLPGDPYLWARTDIKSLREHLKTYVYEYAKNRGVILADRDIKPDLTSIIEDLRNGRRLANHARKETDEPW